MTIIRLSGAFKMLMQVRDIRQDSLRGKVIALAAFTAVAVCGCTTNEESIASASQDLGVATRNQCYLVASNEQRLSLVNTTDSNAATNEVNIGTSLGSGDIEAIAYDVKTDTLYGADSGNGGRLGIINTTTGVFTQRSNIFGTGRGAQGNVKIVDVDGLSFNPYTSELYGSVRRTKDGCSCANRPDLLVRINPATGQIVQNAFGAGIDYVEIDPVAGLTDVDDLAFDPSLGPNGKVAYGTVNTSGNDDHIIRIDLTTGNSTDVGATTIVDDIEGLSFDAYGQLWGSSGSTNRQLFRINKTTGRASSPVPIDNGSDYEAIGCLTVQVSDIGLELTVDNVNPSEGATITYTLTVTNRGPHDATGLVVSDILPAGLRYTSHQASQGVYNRLSGRFDVGALAASGKATLRLTVSVATGTAGTAITHVAHWVEMQNAVDPRDDNNVARAVVSVRTAGGDSTDSDGDGLTDRDEINFGTDKDDADTDDDGIKDGSEPSWNVDSDGDGLINARDPDSDNDGLFDGTETGVSGNPGPATDQSAGNYIPDANPATTTNPLDPDTDDGGIKDGSEDTNKNGRVDAPERNPNNPADDFPRPDSDGDGLTDEEETRAGTNPADVDSDDDGVRDGAEPNWNLDTDGDGNINAKDHDSDNDGIFDGTEMGVSGPAPTGTNASAGHYVPDADPITTTSPLNPDTDQGSVKDGDEDKNKNGRIDSGETDPNDGRDDKTGPVGGPDSDDDGIPNDQEQAAGTNPNDADTDDDGVKDGDEPVWNRDSDGDGLINARDPDSDNDGLLDGTELGVTTPDPATNTSAGNYVADADPKTTTNPLDPDTDRGGVKDGTEDTNKNGRIDANELDPNNPLDDTPPLDSDGDGLSDAEEEVAGTSPTDPDSDDDGVKDGSEPNWNRDTDQDGTVNARDPDSDNDGIFDGTESGVSEAAPAGTDLGAGFYVPDADPTTRTSPVNADTDNGGVADGVEDANKNGRIDDGETDPNDPADDNASAAGGSLAGSPIFDCAVDETAREQPMARMLALLGLLGIVWIRARHKMSR